MEHKSKLWILKSQQPTFSTLTPDPTTPLNGLPRPQININAILMRLLMNSKTTSKYSSLLLQKLNGKVKFEHQVPFRYKYK